MTIPTCFPEWVLCIPGLGQDIQQDQDMAELPLPTGLGVPAATSQAVPVLRAQGRLLSLGGRRGAHTSEQAGSSSSLGSLGFCLQAAGT